MSLTLEQQLQIEQVKRSIQGASVEQLREQIIALTVLQMQKDNLFKKLIDRDCRERFDG